MFNLKNDFPGCLKFWPAVYIHDQLNGNSSTFYKNRLILMTGNKRTHDNCRQGLYLVWTKTQFQIINRNAPARREIAYVITLCSCGAFV